jgi:hypothetical protein
MATAHASGRSWTPRPLTTPEWGEAQRVAERLHTELSHLIALLPEHARGASGMARHLDVLRATCQRVVAALGEGPVGPLVLARLPGVDGLRQFLEGFRRSGADVGEIEAAESAVEAFERLITALGGSQTRLAERLQLSAGPRGAPETGLATPAQREALFNTAVAITGRRCEVSLSIYAFRVAPDSPSVLERGLAKGQIGSVITPGGLPMVLSSGDTVKAEDEVRRLSVLAPGDGRSAPEMRGRTPEAVLRPFSSDPLPMVTSRNRRGKLFQVIDPAAAGEPLDVVTALRARHPLIDPQTGKTTLDAVWSLVSCPTARLIFDVYLHEGLERSYRPSIDALLWTPDLNVADDDKWVMRLPSQPRLQLLGRGLAGAHSELYPRHAELTRYFFDHVGWDPEGFVGFRCEVEFPVWRAGYCMGFEHLDARAPQPAPDLDGQAG